jgi:hypothetical protein
MIRDAHGHNEKQHGEQTSDDILNQIRHDGIPLWLCPNLSANHSFEGLLNHCEKAQ